MENIAQLINSKDYLRLVEACEDFELQIANDSAAQEHVEEFYTILFIAYALVNDLNAARFLRKRLLARNTMPHNAQIDAAWRICVVLWQRRYPDFYEALDAFQWCPLVLALIEDLRESVRAKLTELFQKSYTLIDVPTAVKYFGLPETDLIPGKLYI
ncbi:COP9 signalosome [Dichotomocladium elegans]|nr:COP9 signalosome [Dichotomocladium elegans]